MNQRGERLTVLWADAEHLDEWGPYFDSISAEDQFTFIGLKSVLTRAILAQCDSGDIDVVVIHSGTDKPIRNLKDVLTKLHTLSPRPAVCLQTEAPSPELDSLYHGVIPLCLNFKDYNKILLNAYLLNLQQIIGKVDLNQLQYSHVLSDQK